MGSSSHGMMEFAFACAKKKNNICAEIQMYLFECAKLYAAQCKCAEIRMYLVECAELYVAQCKMC